MPPVRNRVQELHASGHPSSNPYSPTHYSPQKVTSTTSKLLRALDETARPPPTAGPSYIRQEKTYGESPKKKRAKKTKEVDPDAPAPEKRAARFKKGCPQNILERVERVMSQR